MGGAAFSLSLRLLRGQASRAWLFVFCIAVGVAARVSVASFLASLDAGLGREAPSLLTADIEVSGRTPLPPEELAQLRAVLPVDSRQSDKASLLTMASAGPTLARRSRLVQLTAVDGAYPLVGEMLVEGRWQRSADLQGHARAYVQPELLLQLGVALGDKLRLGQINFEIAGILRKDPGIGAEFFSLGPKVLVGLDPLAATGLLAPGGRRSYETLFAVPDPAQGDELAKRSRRALGLSEEERSTVGASGEKRKVRSVRQAQGDLKRFFERLADYLGLVSLMALLLGGVGVASLTRAFVREASPQLGILQSLGAVPGFGRRLFAWQSAVLGLLGGLLGVVLGLLAQGLLPSALNAFLPVRLEAVWAWGPCLWGLALALLTALAFGLDPVLAAGEQSPASLLRDEDPAQRWSWQLWAWRLGLAAVFAAVSALEARSWTRGPASFGVLLVGALCLQLLGGWLLPKLAALRHAPLPMGIRHGLANLGRPGLRAGATVVALGSAALLLGGLVIHQHSLLAELSPGKSRKEMPDLFLIDVQRDQAEPLKRWAQAQGLVLELSPMVRARYRGNLVRGDLGQEKTLTREQQDARAMRDREQNLSWRPALGKGETLIEGRWMDVNGQELEASLEQGFAKRLNAKLGDLLRFDVQGVEIEAKVTSLRKVHWASFQPNFFILLSPWALEDAPQTWIGSLRGSADADARARIQTALVQRFPNVTLFDVAEGTAKILGILDKITGAVRLVAAFSLAAGLVVLAGLALATARARRAESALLKVLGASRSQLLQAAGIEFGVLAAVAATLGLGLSLGLGSLVLSRALDLAFVAPWGPLAQLWLLFTLTGAAVGLLASWRAYGVKPVRIMRAD